MKDQATLKIEVSNYVNLVAIQETERMDRYFNLMTDIRTVFPDTSARKIEDAIGMRGFGKSQIALGLALVRDFNSPPNMTIFEYSRHSSFLSKLDHDKRLDVARELHDAGTDKKKVDEIKSRFGFGPAVSSIPLSSPADFALKREQIKAFVEKVNKAGELEYLLTEVFAIPEADIALKSAKKAIADKAKAERRLALKKKAA